jgi:hypothetical protein
MRDKNSIFIINNKEYKKCNLCNLDKLLESYNKCDLKKSKIRGECKECQRNTRKKYSINNYNPQKEYLRKATQMYKITEKEYTSLYKKSNGCCFVCKIPENNFKRRLHLDHDHLTGKVRGLLCKNCNNALGNVKDSKEILKRLIEYLGEAK